ncbi:fumarylacetoacetate hydrolase family protein [Hephaestia sp. GCM10023244]|uniref:fumarylacetoacetate hydrolase family protein n=1 Tax=unclassified Hephaestia TaxID=2631281 RepID=UPI002077217A|nr:fumarylacetoacetate hydrolase family protein [Hephaestia sp. MAHUQ-44]MCM8730272.1 fumarylacetoacetate hydrolase family protein [Hephaestia sp. MAHUQ-44]
MKLCRFGKAGEEKPGAIDGDGRIRDLSGVIADLGPAELAPERLRALAAIDLTTLPLVAATERLGPPITGTRQFLAIGLNYSDHARESGMEIPAEPVLFTKGVSCIQGPNDPIAIPPGSTKTDWEVELGVVIGTKASYVTEADALSHVAGYCVVDDVSERAYQLERSGTWDKGKGCPTFGPLGPWLVTADEVGDPQALSMWLDVNGERVQTGNTRTMIFGVAHLVSYVSHFMTLLPGDVITTGTPPGVGMGQKPPRYLKAGDVVTLGIEKLGDQRQQVIGG